MKINSVFRLSRTFGIFFPSQALIINLERRLVRQAATQLCESNTSELLVSTGWACKMVLLLIPRTIMKLGKELKQIPTVNEQYTTAIAKSQTQCLCDFSYVVTGIKALNYI